MSTPKRTPAPAPVAPPPAPAVPTPAAEFRRGGVWELPHSGNLVELRWPGLYALALQGEIPNPLAGAVLRLVSGAAATTGDEPESEDDQVASYRKDAKSFLGVAARCLVHPRLILDREPDYERDEIGPQDLHELDVLWIYAQFVQRGPASEHVAPFRRS